MAQSNKSSVHVGGLSSSVDEAALFETFNRLGSVRDVRLVSNHSTGERRGHAYVNFYHSNTADKAIKELHNTELKGSIIRVNVVERDNSLRRTQKGNLVFKKLPLDLDHAEFLKELGTMGEIASHRFSEKDKAFIGVAFVHFRDMKAAEHVLETYNGKDYKGNSIVVEHFRRQSERRENAWTNVFVKGFGETLSDDDFKKMAPNSKSVYLPIPEGKSIGYGFVDFETHAEAVEFVKEINGKKIGDVELLATRFLNKKEYSYEKERKFKEHRTTLNKSTAGRNLYVRGIPVDATDDDFKNAFIEFGNIVSMRVRRSDEKPDTTIGYGYICFSTVAEAEAAIKASEANRILINGDSLTVDCYKTRESILKERSARENTNQRNPNHNMGGMHNMMHHMSGLIHPIGGMYPNHGMAANMAYGYNHNKPHVANNRAPAHNKIPAVAPAPVQSVQDTLHRSIEGKNEDEAREYLGNLLYPKVQEVASPNSDVGKITGMLLGMGTEETIIVLEKPESLAENVAMAEDMLKGKDEGADN